MDAILWRRLDAEGHDSCRLTQRESGFALEGTAAFWEAGVSCGLTYEVACDAGFRALSARVTGAMGPQRVELHFVRVGERWLFGGVEQPELAGLVDLDLGFTPATNLLALRRLQLPVGAQSAAPAAYLAFPELRMERLEQTYRRLDPAHYHYTASAYGYDGVITVASSGFVTDYPGLWTAVGL